MTVEWLLEQLKLAWAVLKTPLVEVSGATLTLSSLIFALFVVALSFRLASAVGRLVNRTLAQRRVDSGVRDSLERFVRYVVILVGCLFSLDLLGFSLNSLAALGAVLMVGVGFGLQNIAQNFISGIIILIERPVKVGDIIRVGGTSGKITEIGVRSTRVLTRDDVSIIVPNSKLVAEDVVNESFLNHRIRLHVRVGVAYGSDVELVKSLLSKVALAHPEVFQEPAPLIIFESFGESSLDFDLRFWTGELWEADRVCSELRFRVDAAFREHGVQIPFPQRDLHLKTAWPVQG